MCHHSGSKNLLSSHDDSVRLLRIELHQVVHGRNHYVWKITYDDETFGGQTNDFRTEIDRRFVFGPSCKEIRYFFLEHDHHPTESAGDFFKRLARGTRNYR